jgi:TPR repeat protein
VRLWRQLSEIETVEPEDAELKVDVLNNLGYMLFFGYGVDVSRKEALAFWHSAVGMGSVESEYHLCHEYADADEPTYDAVKASAHCDKAELVYLGKEKRDENEDTILRQIQNHKKQLTRQRK